jgi:hypothetical protein
VAAQPIEWNIAAVAGVSPERRTAMSRPESRPEHENSELVKQHAEKARMDHQKLENESSKQPPHQMHMNDKTPPHKGDPQQVQNVPGGEDLKRGRRPDADETYRTGRRGKR